MISGQLFGILLLNLIVDGLGDMEANIDYEDSTPFQCNDQNQPGGSDKPSSKARTFIRLKGKPFNCEDDISVYYEIEDCGEIDELRSSFHNGNLNCRWENGPGNGQDCNTFNLQEFEMNDEVGKGWYGCLDAKGVLAMAYVPRNRETCPSQVLYSSVEEDLRKEVIRTFSAYVNESDPGQPPGHYKLTTQVNNNSRKVEEVMTYCGDQSHYKWSFYFYRNSDNSTECSYRKFVGGHENEGFEFYENLQNCGDFADYCNVYTNQTTGVNQFNCIPLTDLEVGLEVTGPGDGNSMSLIIRLGTSDTPEQKKFCPKVVIDLDGGARQNDQSRRLKSYVGFHKEEDDTMSKYIYVIISYLISFLQP